MREYGHVVSISEQAAVVAMRMSGECKKCGLCMKSSDGKEVLLLAKNEVDASVGDIVEIEISPGKVIAAAFIVYMIPIIMTVVGFLIGSALVGGSEESGIPIGMAVIFLVASFFGVWMYDKRVRRKETREATVLRVVEDEDKKHVELVKLGG